MEKWQLAWKRDRTLEIQGLGKGRLKETNSLPLTEAFSSRVLQKGALFYGGKRCLEKNKFEWQGGTSKREIRIMEQQAD